MVCVESDDINMSEGLIQNNDLYNSYQDLVHVHATYFRLNRTIFCVEWGDFFEVRTQL